MSELGKLYSSVDELIGLAQKSLRPYQSMDFILSVAKQWEENHELSEKQIKALENIARPELNRRREESMMDSLF